MKPITFTKSFIFEENIVKVQDFLVEDDFSYEIKDSDLSISGKISGSGSAKSEVDTYPFTFIIDVDCLLSLAKIDCLTDLKLRFKDYKSTIDGKLLTLTIRYELFGNGEVYKDVITKEDKSLQRKLYDTMTSSTVIEDVNPAIDSNFKEKIEKILDEKVEVISTLDELKPLNSFSKEIDEIEEAKIQPIPFVAPIEKYDDRKNVEDNKIEEKKETIFKEKYVVTYIYYKVKDSDNYSNVSEKFKVSEKDLRNCNSSKDIRPGMLLKIPNK